MPQHHILLCWVYRTICIRWKLDILHGQRVQCQPWGCSHRRRRILRMDRLGDYDGEANDCGRG